MKNDLDTVLRSLGSTALGSVRLKPFSDEPAPPLCSGGETSACELKKGDFEFYRDSLLKGLNFPYREASAYPPAIISGTSRVGVIDTQLDVDHCAFAALKAAGRLIRIGPAAKLATVTPPIAPCEWMLPRANVDISTSHGTHVAGIIAGRYKDLVWGLNPYVTLFTGHVPLTGTADAEEVKLGDLSELLASMLTESARIGGLDVVNFSFYYARPSAASSDASGRAQRAFGDPVLQTIKTLGKNTLFVVAAGNDHEQFSAICDSRPSCFDLPNVISVGALNDSSPTAPLLSLSGARGSNFGRRVHVATPGHNVFSSISGNYFGVLSGTSQAAPQVAAVASLLRAANSYLTPGEVKERLITCSTSIPISSNPSPDEDIEAGGVVFGGRVDAACTLEKLGWLELKSAPTPILVKEVRANEDLVFTPADRTSPVYFNPRTIRGIRANVEDNTFTIYHRRAGDDPDAALSREERVEPLAGQEQKLSLTIVGPGGSSRNFLYPIKDIVRFVPPLRKQW